MFNSLATRRMKQDPGSGWLFSIPSICFFLKPCFSGVSGLLQDCKELGSLTNSTKAPILVAQFKHKKSVFGLDAMSSGTLRFTEEAASQVPKMLTDEQHDAVLGCRKEQREGEEQQSPVLCRRTHFFYCSSRVKSMLLKTAVRSETNCQSMESEMHKI